MEEVQEIRKPKVVFQPDNYQGMQKGINKILNAIRPTLGPYPRLVANAQTVSQKSPELLDDGGTIARRIIQIPNRAEDVGAMFIRQVLWQLHQRVGDGTATAAVLFQVIYNQGLRYLAAGGNAMELRHHLEAGMRLINDELNGMTIYLKEGRERKEKLAQVAKSICYDPSMAELLGEIFDVIGEYGRLDIRSGRGRELEREYVEGMYWKGGVLSRLMITDEKRQRTDLENAVIVISNLDVQEPQDLIPAVSIALKGGYKTMLLIVKRISDAALSVLVSEKTRAKIQVLAVETPGATLTDQAAFMEDLSILTGGHPLAKQAGQTLRDVRPPDLGRARRVWSDKTNSGLSGGKGKPRELRQHVARLRMAYYNSEDNEDRKKILERISKLMGGSATLWIGGSTESEIKARKELAERTAQAVRGAVIDGILPGGGLALLACRPALQARLEQSTAPAERAAYRILTEAAEEPLRALLTNAGHNPSRILAEINRAGPGYGFDLHREQVVNMVEAGIFDPAAVQKDAIRSAISSAALALTIEVTVHRRKPVVSMEP